MQVRLNSAISNMDTRKTNLAESLSRIQDTDIAAETARNAKNQILLQAGMQGVQQAKQLSQGSLSLIRAIGAYGGKR